MSNYEILEKGKTYWINIDDCCVKGSFEGKFRAFGLNTYTPEGGHSTRFHDTLPENYEDIDEYPDLYFDIGTLSWHDAVTFQEIGDN